jgi:peptidoglycan/LPS O-acetylase OafA/YrhL
VLLYHAGVPGVSGGFIGVDVFFVISGFLITGLLLRELRATGKVSLPSFYARRARRLLPAAMVALATTMVVSAIVLPPLIVPDVAGDVASSALYVGNIHFAVQATDYLQADVAPSPVLHFWSLGVEEQFYLFWPALLLLAAGVGRVGRTLERRVGAAVLAVLAASLVLSIWLTDVNQPWAFFSLPTRAWELSLGALLALGAARLARAPVRAATVAVWAGLGLIAIGALRLDTATPFPGTAALLPVIGAALVIAGGLGPAGTLPGRALAAGPMRWLGRISYSLYLWHWPIIVLPAAALDTELPLAIRIGLALLAIPVAAASQRWIEEPVRHGRLTRVPSRSTLAVAGGLSLAVAVGSLGLGAVAGVPAPPIVAGSGPVVAGGTDTGGASPSLDAPRATGATPLPDVSASASPTSPETSPSPAPPAIAIGGALPANLAPPLAQARGDMPIIYTDGCHLPASATTSPSCAYGDIGSATEVVLFGDSHAAQWFPALERIASERGWRLTSLTKSACPSADVTVWSGSLRREYRECDTWRQAVVERIVASRPALVVLANSRVATLLVDGHRIEAADAPETWLAGLGRTIDQLREADGAVVVLGDTPRSSVDPPVCLSRHPQDTLACATPRSTAVDAEWLRGEAATADTHGASFIDPTDMVCTADTCPAVIGRYLVQRDDHHFATPFAASLAPQLAAALPTIP